MIGASGSQENVLCCLGAPEEELGLPFQVVQKEEEGQQVGLWEGQQQIKHTALLCNRV